MHALTDEQPENNVSAAPIGWQRHKNM